MVIILITSEQHVKMFVSKEKCVAIDMVKHLFMEGVSGVFLTHTNLIIENIYNQFESVSIPSVILKETSDSMDLNKQYS